MNRNRAVLAQGLYYVATGIWPFLHLRSFLRVTGPKRDIWLVRTVGALAAAIGIPLIRAAMRRDVGPETRLLSTTSAVAFAAVDVGYVAAGRIPPVYLADALVQLGVLGADS